MAKKRTGVVSAMGNLFRWIIYGLAAVLVFAIYLGWSGQTDEEIASAPETVTPEAPVEAPATDAAQEAPDAAEQAEVAVQGAVDQVTEEVETAIDEVQTEINEVAAEAEAKADAIVDEVTQELAAVTDQVQSAVDDVAGAAGDALSQGANTVAGATTGATTMSSFTVPGDDATYALTNAFRRDDGNIEFTTERTGADGVAQTVTRLVSCAPLASGVIVEGDGARTDDPEMERLVLGSPEASVAAKACGVFR